MRADVNNSPYKEACRRWAPMYYGFRRNNTPEHAKRLIPRCVTSTPWSACERCVLQWNARRKDLFWQLWELGATVAEILLHSEARSSGVTLVKTTHVTREPWNTMTPRWTNCLQTATRCRWAVPQSLRQRRSWSAKRSGSRPLRWQQNSQC